MINVNICVLVFVIVSPVFSQTDYCELCENHIACKNAGQFADNCQNPQIMPLTSELQGNIVGKHNKLRNQVAKGFGKFPHAERMASLQWSNELAKLAVYNVKQCQMQHDKCRNTKVFKYAGQNIAQTEWWGMNLNIIEVIDSHIDRWFNEYNNCPPSIIKSYKDLSNDTHIGHFTAMIQEKSTHVGCAVLRTKSDGYFSQIMTCNYAYDNIIGRPVYTEGKTASKCQTGVNAVYESLCSEKEKYNVNI